jgi:hypothetical protein
VRKLVIMTSGRDSLKGKDAVLQEILELGLEAGIDLENARGSFFV